MSVGIGTTVEGSFPATLQRVEEALKGEGFGVLTRIDVQATLKEKLGASMPPYVILGACNPPLAHRAISAEPEIGLLLPCNVVVREDGGRIRVEAIDATTLSTLIQNPEIASVADEVNAKLRRVIEAV